MFLLKDYKIHVNRICLLISELGRFVVNLSLSDSKTVYMWLKFGFS